MVRLIRFSYWMENFSRTFHLLLVFSPALDMTKCFLADLFNVYTIVLVFSVFTGKRKRNLSVLFNIP